jgi:hypothetical protein
MAADRAAGLPSYSDPDADVPRTQDELDMDASEADAELLDSNFGLKGSAKRAAWHNPHYFTTEHAPEEDPEILNERLVERREIWTERILQAMRLAVRMLQDDDAVRPRGSRRRPVLNKKAIGSLVDNLDVEAEFEHWKAQWRRDALKARQKSTERGEVRRLKAARDAAWAGRNAERSEAERSEARDADSAIAVEVEASEVGHANDTTTPTPETEAETPATLEAQIHAEIAAELAAEQAKKETQREEGKKGSRKKE